MKLLQRMTRRTVVAKRVLYIDQEHALAFQTCGSDMCWNNYCRLRDSKNGLNPPILVYRRTCCRLEA